MITSEFFKPCLVLLVSLAVSPADAPAQKSEWVMPPSAGQLKSMAGLKHHVFDSKSMGCKVGYCVVTPAGYQKTKQRYPVVYWLHGGGGHESSTLYTARAWLKLRAEGKIDPAIIVYPTGRRAGYMDHADGKTLAESMIIKELVPLIDKQYRTIALRRGRAMHGFSMGSSGSLKFVFKYPDLFGSAVAYGGGAIDLERTKKGFVRNILKRNLNNDPALIRANNTYHFLKVNGDAVRMRGTRIVLITGDKDSWYQSAVDFHAALSEKKIPSQLWTVKGVGHSLGQLYKAKGEAAAVVQDEVFKKLAKK